MRGLAMVRVARDRLRVVNLDDIYLLEAEGGDTLVHRRSTAPLRDARTLGQLLEGWAGHPFVRIHESFAVHPARIFEVRMRENGRDWELKLEPPLNRVVPIGRDRATALFDALGG